MILEKAVDPRKLQKAQKYSKRYQDVGSYSAIQREWLCYNN